MKEEAKLASGVLYTFARNLIGVSFPLEREGKEERPWERGIILLRENKGNKTITRRENHKRPRFFCACPFAAFDRWIS